MQGSSELQNQSSMDSPKIYFSQKIFGKPTKNRTEDPSMFDLLSWPNQMSVESSDFKKKQRFVDPETAYMSMISRQPWVSESQESHLNFHANSIPVNEEVFREVENYIQGHQSKGAKQKATKHEFNIESKNKNELIEHNGYRNQRNTVQHGQKQKVPQSSPKRNNYINENQEKQNHNKDKRDLKKRPGSARSTAQIHSPKMQNSKQVPMTFEDHQFQEEMMKKKDEISEEEQEKLIERFKQTTRWIPNSSFMTYFGKPPFQNYGRGNTKPVDGGLVYGTYLYSHSVHPHRGANCPSHVQSYPVALMKAKSMGRLVPTQPKTACKYLENKINNEKEKQYYEGTGAIEAMKNIYSPLEVETPNLHTVEKFGASKLSSSKGKFYTENDQENLNNQGKKYASRKL